MVVILKVAENVQKIESAHVKSAGIPELSRINKIAFQDMISE